MHTYMHACMHTYIHTCIHTYIHKGPLHYTDTDTDRHTHTHTHTHTYVRTGPSQRGLYTEQKRPRNEKKRPVHTFFSFFPFFFLFFLRSARPTNEQKRPIYRAKEAHIPSKRGLHTEQKRPAHTQKRPIHTFCTALGRVESSIHGTVSRSVLN